MQVEKISDSNREKWDHSVSVFTQSHPFNSYGWGKVRKIDGWKPHYYMASEGGAVRGMIMVLVKKIPLLGLSIMYAPKGPLCDQQDSETLAAILDCIIREARKYKSIFLRIEPNVVEDKFFSMNDPFVNKGFHHLEHRWSFWNSPRDVYRIDLTKFSTVEDMFNSLDRDTRRCVRKAKKEGVTIQRARTLGELATFYQIFRQFSADKGFLCRQYRYQEALWKEFIEKANGDLFLAIYKDKIIGGLICLRQHQKCVAMHMGTPPQYNKLQTYYAYVWESIRWAKEKGCHWYSFRGVGTTATQERFKRKFGPRVVSLAGYYDLPFKPILYRIFKFVEFQLLPKVYRTIMLLRKNFYNSIERLSTTTKS